jgi:nitroreductase
MKVKFDEVLMDLIKKRRSVRLFNGKKIPKKELLSIIEAGTWAPTGCNNQELRFVILDTQEELNDITKFKPFLKGMSNFILVFSDMSLAVSKEAYGWKGGSNLPYIDTGLALMNMTLYAKSKNIDSCVCNLSDYHMRLILDKKETLLRKVRYKLISKLDLLSHHEDSLIFYLRNHMKIPDHLEITCGLALGYAKVYPDINKEKHGGQNIKRKNVNYYILKH